MVDVTVELQERINVLELELAAAKSEALHWQNNHKCEVARARFLKERTDVPLERIRAYEEFGKALSKINEQELAIKVLASLVTTNLCFRSENVDRYQHYKGGLYIALTISALESNPEQKMVTYIALKDGAVFTRTLENFTEIIEVDGVKVPRFKKLE